MLEIPGEEAPTDPGVQVKQRQEQEEKVRQAARRKKNRILGVLALMAFAGVGTGGYFAWQSQQAALTYEMDDYYALPLEDITAAPPEAPPSEVVAAAGTPGGKPSSGGRKPSGVGENALAMADRSTESSPIKRATGGDGGGEIAGGPSTALPTAGGGVGLGGGGVRITQVGSDVVLTDPAEIFDMAKRVINASSPQLSNCYNQRLKQVENLKGAWEVSFTIGKDGSAKGVRVGAVNDSDGELESCMSRAVQSWRFQKISKDQPVKKTYRFGAGSW